MSGVLDPRVANVLPRENHQRVFCEKVRNHPFMPFERQYEAAVEFVETCEGEITEEKIYRFLLGKTWTRVSRARSSGMEMPRYIGLPERLRRAQKKIVAGADRTAIALDDLMSILVEWQNGVEVPLHQDFIAKVDAFFAEQVAVREKINEARDRA